MHSITDTLPRPAVQFEVIMNPDGTYSIKRDGFMMTDQYGRPRKFSGRNGARKCISRERGSSK